MTHDAYIEAILFFKAEPVSIGELSKLLKISVRDVREALGVLEEKLAGRGLTLVYDQENVTITTSSAASQMIEQLVKHDLEKSIGKAGLETLAIIIYRGPVTRPQIDYIRGVNSRYIVRQLLMRGLIQREVSTIDRRTHVYTPTIELLQYLGISSVNELPEYERVQEAVDTFAQTKESHEETLTND